MPSLLTSRPLLLALLASLLLLKTASAATTITGTAAFVAENPANGAGSGFEFAQAGTGGIASPFGQSGLLFFELPNISSAPGITLAQLTVKLTMARVSGVFGQVPDSFNVDLYFLGLRPAVSINEPGDYCEQGVGPAGATLVLDNWWLAGDDTQIGTSKSIDVTTQIESSYTLGVPNDGFAVFALCGDTDYGLSNTRTTYFFEELSSGDTPELEISSQGGTPVTEVPGLSAGALMLLAGVLSSLGVGFVRCRTSLTIK